MVAWRDKDGGQGADSTAAGRRPRLSRAARIGGWLFILLLGLVLAAATVAWLSRKPIANRILADEMAKRGVRATYTLERIGLRTQEVSNLVIGDPARPDLTVDHAFIQLRLKWDGSVEIYRVVARRAHLRAAIVGNRVTFGDVDKLLPPPSGKPFTLPDMVIDLKGGTVGLQTPYGPFGLALMGRGNLSGGFKGKLAGKARQLRPGPCTLDAFHLRADVEVAGRRPAISGPLTAAAFGCPAAKLRLAAPRVDLDASFSEGFDRFRGDGRLSLSSASVGSSAAAGINSKLSFAGTPRQVSGSIALTARQARMTDILAQRTRFDGGYRFDVRRATLSLAGKYGASDVAVRPAAMAALTDPLRSVGGTPLTPVLRAMADGVDRAARRFDAAGDIRLVNGRGGGGVRIGNSRLSSASGAEVSIDGGDGINFYWPDNRLRIEGVVRTRGGGLPDARLALVQPRSGGPLSGTATVAPYGAGGARLALSDVRFTGRRDGWTEISTIALVDGPFDGGRVTGLRVPISGRVGRGGALEFGRGCIDSRFASLSVGSLRLGPTSLPLCADRGAIVRKSSVGPLALSLMTRGPVALRGQLGDSPFAFDAARARFAMGPGFSIDRARVRMGKTDAPVLINAYRVIGRFAGAGAQGQFSGADALIGRIPLRISDAGGGWSVRNGDLDVDGGLTLSDTAEPSRFYPLKGEGVRFTLADSRIRATGALRHPYSGALISNVQIHHDLASGNGGATLDVPGITFGPNLQPEELTRLTEGVIALVVGQVHGRGQIAWTGDGDVTSTGDFTTDNMNLAASFGPITGLKGTIHFTDLLGLQTGPGQTATIEGVNPGILVENGVLRYQLLPDNLVKIERGEWPFMGGRLILQETILNLGRDAPRRLTFEVVGLDARLFVDSMGFKEIGASGTFDGVLPMIFDDEGGRIVGGRLDSREGGGTLAYNGVVNRANLGMFGGMAFDALRDLRFRSMIIRLDGYLDGEFATRLTVDQVGLGNTSTQQFLKSVNKIPFKFNVTIKGPFRALIATAKSFNDATDVISPALPRPLDEVPGIIVETRRREESQEQTQTPVDQKVDVSTTPAKNP